MVTLAQRIPVRIELTNVPKETILSSGMTFTGSITQETNSKKAAHCGDPVIRNSVLVIFGALEA